MSEWDEALGPHSTVPTFAICLVLAAVVLCGEIDGDAFCASQLGVTLILTHHALPPDLGQVPEEEPMADSPWDVTDRPSAAFER